LAEIQGISLFLYRDGNFEVSKRPPEIKKKNLKNKICLLRFGLMKNGKVTLNAMMRMMRVFN
jgi:hypothetical protein